VDIGARDSLTPAPSRSMDISVSAPTTKASQHLTSFFSKAPTYCFYLNLLASKINHKPLSHSSRSPQ